jgi:hypothetical protein
VLSLKSYATTSARRTGVRSIGAAPQRIKCEATGRHGRTHRAQQGARVIRQQAGTDAIDMLKAKARLWRADHITEVRTVGTRQVRVDLAACTAAHSSAGPI